MYLQLTIFSNFLFIWLFHQMVVEFFIYTFERELKQSRTLGIINTIPI